MMRSRLRAIVLFIASLAAASMPGESNAQGCPPDDDYNRELVEHFVSFGDYSSDRNEFGIPTISPGQVSAVQQSWLCNYLLSQESGIVNAQYDDGEPLYYISIYQGGGFYFVVATIRQHSSGDYLHVGKATIAVYDANVNRLVTFGF